MTVVLRTRPRMLGCAVPLLPCKFNSRTGAHLGPAVGNRQHDRRQPALHDAQVVLHVGRHRLLALRQAVAYHESRLRRQIHLLSTHLCGMYARIGRLVPSGVEEQGVAKYKAIKQLKRRRPSGFWKLDNFRRLFCMMPPCSPGDTRVMTRAGCFRARAHSAWSCGTGRCICTELRGRAPFHAGFREPARASVPLQPHQSLTWKTAAPTYALCRMA